ncbi:MAG: hypothetical protein QOE06_243 [Thermoleophilaceae bacterium]|nr:hypothetical protein [Thermoleophilaceae bacterium]
MSLLATIRPDDVNFPLFMHVLGAMVLVGSLLLTVCVLAGAWGSGSVALTRIGYRTLLMAVLPSWLVTRVFAQIVLDKPFYKNTDNQAWVGIGFTTTELGLLLIIAATVAAGLGARKARRTGATVGASRKVAAVLVSLLVVFYVIAIWAMTTKPT